MRRSRMLYGALALLLALAMPHAYAQQTGGARGQGSAVQGDAGGGSSGASNRGGAGGIANPDPGGGPADAAGPSAGPGSTTTRRPGYLGGRVTDDGGDSGGGSVAAPASGSSRFACHDVNPSAMSPVARMSGPNFGRIVEAGEAVRPAQLKGRSRSARFLMASFQEELAKPAPDFELAATYLGMASSQPLTPEVTMRVSEILCVPLSNEQAGRVSAVAEGQRLRLEADAK